LQEEERRPSNPVAAEEVAGASTQATAEAASPTGLLLSNKEKGRARGGVAAQ
jgi:hypothetical protein